MLDGRLADGSRVRVSHAGGRITQIESTDDAPDQWLLPGLIDLQVNGYAGLDVNSAELTTSVIHELVRSEAACGVTGFCPTIVTGSEERIVHALAVIAAARAEDDRTRHAVLGVHVEGPYLSAEDGPRGAHDVAHLRLPSIDEFDRWQRAGRDTVRIVTLAPELPGALEYIRHLRAHGVVVAIGHTAALPEQVAAAVDAGARLSTHLGNGAHPTLPRHPNYIWSQLAESRLSATFISDGHHLPADVFLAMARAKGAGRRIIVSDSVALAGSTPGDYVTPVGGAVTLHADGRLTLAGTELLAGSASSLRDCLAWAVQQVGFSLVSGADMTASTPATLLGATDRGRLEVGAWADLTVLSEDLDVLRTVVRGEVVHDAETPRRV